MKLYVVQPGDCLSLIAKRIYGDGDLWPVIYRTNCGAILSAQRANNSCLRGPDWIFAGTPLLIPERCG